MSDPVDLFSPTVHASQLSLFGDDGGRMEPVRQSVVPDLEVVRGRLNLILASAREARSMPWPDRDARMWRTVFPQMADWLPEAEADQLRLAFAEEIRRLEAA